jgi:hypothetical protein
MRKTAGFLLLVLAATVASAQASGLKVRIGAATSDGSVNFTLSHVASGDTVDVTLSLPAGASPVDKAAAIADAVANVGVPGTWRAVSGTTGAALSFQHLLGDEWVDVDSITGLGDTTGAGTQIETLNEPVDFTLDLDSEAVATGVDLQGGPSFITISVTNTLTFTRTIQAGDTAQSLIDQFEAFMAEQGAEGVTVTRTGPSSLKIHLSSASSALNWQVSDTGVLLVAKGSGQIITRDASLIER